MKRVAAFLIIVFFLISLTYCNSEPRKQTASEADDALVLVADGMIVPRDNPMTAAKVALGKRLFFDPSLSRDSSISCASCHIPEYAFSDTIALSDGVGGVKTLRNSPSLVNAGFHPLLMREGGNKTLEIQVFSPVEGETEMHMPMAKLIGRLAQNQSYVDQFEAVFQRGGVDAYGITRAIAAYERTIVGGPSAFDLYLDGDSTAISDAAKAGYALFRSDSLACISCHNGPLFSDFSFHNNGTKEFYEDRGRYRLTQDEGDIGKFKVPSLKNIAITGPYMFDGSFESLEAVVDHYSSGGSEHVNKDERIKGFEISEEQKAQLIAFLNSLTEEKTYLP